MAMKTQIVDINGTALTLSWNDTSAPPPTPTPLPTPTPTPLPVPPPTPTPIPPVPGTARQLRVSDLTYLGMLRCPTSGASRMDGAAGSMTGRVVNGQTRILITGQSSVLKDPLYEFSDPGGYGATLGMSPVMPLVKVWGDIYGSHRVTYDNATGQIRPIAGMSAGGMHWSEKQQLLYWTYYDNYNVAILKDWSLGATRLDPAGPTPFGPWRVSATDGKKGPWHGTRVSEHPVTGEMLVGASLASGNNSSPWGPECWSGAFPNASTPAGYGAPDLPVQKYLTYYPAISQIKPDGSFTAPLKSARRPGDYLWEGCMFTSGGVQTEIDPAKNGGVGSWTQLDLWHDLTWIDLPDRFGVLYTGSLMAAHIWYSNAGAGHLNCCHGMPPPVSVTGPVSTDGYPFMAIYNPADLAAVRAGTMTDYTVNPVELVNGTTRWNLLTAPIGDLQAKNFCGQYFNPQTRKLYVCAPSADHSTPFYFVPVVHVFQVN